MSDEEEDMSEGFSASEDEWKPGKDTRGGETSDDDDSDFEDEPVASSSGGSRAKKEPKPRTVSRGAVSKKRKPMGQSLRTKLYNKYRPPPKTFPSGGGANSPSTSNSRTASKNARTPNESRDSGDDSSSESSVDDYLVNPADLDFRSSFFNADNQPIKITSPAPTFDCNVGIKTLSDSGSEDDNETSHEDRAAATKAFDFRNLLEKANSLERAKDAIAKRTAETKERNDANSTAAMDVNTLLALGEKNASFEEEQLGPSKLTKTKSTRVKRHTKTRPPSALMAAAAAGGANAADSDESEFEEVADDGKQTSREMTRIESLEIHVDLPGGKKRTKQEKQQHELEMALKRKLNREIKERQLLLHKASLLCCFARSYNYNKLLNDTTLMRAALKLLPSTNSYPTERGTEIKYFQSFITWFKTAIKLTSNCLYPAKVPKSKSKLKQQLLEQIQRKEAKCRQDFVFIFVILTRGMGLQCRLVVNMQPLALRPSQADLLTIKLKPDDDKKDGKKESKTTKSEKSPSNSKESKAKEELNSSQEQKSSSTRKRSDKKTKKTERLSDGETSPDEAEVNQPKATRTRTTRSRSRPGADKSLENSENKTDGIKTEPAETANARATRARRTPTRKEPETTSTAANEKRKQFASTKAKSSHSSTDKPNLSKLKRMISAATSDEEPNNKRLFNTTNPSDGETTMNQSAFEGFSDVEHPSSNADQLTAERKKLESLGSRPLTEMPKITIEKCESVKEENVPGSIVDSEEQPKLSERKVGTRSKSPKTEELKTKTTRTRSKSPKIEGLETKTAKGSTRTRSKSPKIKVDPSFLTRKASLKNASDDEENIKPKPNPRTRSKSPKIKVDPTFLKRKDQALDQKDDQSEPVKANTRSTRALRTRSLSPKTNVANVSTDSKSGTTTAAPDKDQNGNVEEKPKRVLRTRQPATSEKSSSSSTLQIPQLDGADDLSEMGAVSSKSKRSKLKKLNKTRSKETDNSEDDFEPSPPKRPKQAPVLPKSVQQLRKDRRVLSTDDEEKKETKDGADFWVEMWSDVEEQWVSIDLVKGKVHSIDAIRKAASSSLAYVFAFQNDLSLKDVTARYCPHWTTTVRKARVEKAWLDVAIAPYIGRRTVRDLCEDQELRRIHEEKPLPTAIGDFKDHPLYALERHLLKFQAIYPPDAPTLGFIRGEPIYARECVHTLHSREIWLKQARTVKLGEQPYKIVKARPKWDRLTQSVIKDQPLEIFGYWQTEDYDPPTAENGMVPRNAYGNVELFKECMLPKKTVHLRLSGLNRICKKLGIDCANAVVGFDFHQGACHPTYDGFVVCEEFEDQVVAAWHQDQEDQERKDQEKYEARVYGNWKKLIRGLLIRERLKKKYNF